MFHSKSRSSAFVPMTPLWNIEKSVLGCCFRNSFNPVVIYLFNQKRRCAILGFNTYLCLTSAGVGASVYFTDILRTRGSFRGDWYSCPKSETVEAFYVPWICFFFLFLSPTTIYYPILSYGYIQIPHLDMPHGYFDFHVRRSRHGCSSLLRKRIFALYQHWNCGGKP